MNVSIVFGKVLRKRRKVFRYVDRNLQTLCKMSENWCHHRSWDFERSVCRTCDTMTETGSISEARDCVWLVFECFFILINSSFRCILIFEFRCARASASAVAGLLRIWWEASIFFPYVVCFTKYAWVDNIIIIVSFSICYPCRSKVPQSICACRGSRNAPLRR